MAACTTRATSPGPLVKKKLPARLAVWPVPVHAPQNKHERVHLTNFLFGSVLASTTDIIQGGGTIRHDTKRHERKKVRSMALAKHQRRRKEEAYSENILFLGLDLSLFFLGTKNTGRDNESTTAFRVSAVPDLQTLVLAVRFRFTRRGCDDEIPSCLHR